MLTHDIRRSFLSFFEKNGHTVVESSCVVPHNDPTLLFTNAGMVQFKNVFTGLEAREYKRAATSQKCVRAGGKHNDLDQVGFTARHHTFFEMLGNFSFGDYFKEDAIDFAWKFLTKELGISKNKLLVTIYSTDEEAKNIWKKVAGDITIIPIPTSDNFWSMGDTGPCGPCTEIFYDHGENVFGGMPGSADENGDRYMEIWNIVFMQFEQMKNGEKIHLQKKSIDTGMGLERLAGVMQGVNDNYLSDLFKGIIDEIKSISGTNHNDIYPSYKVIADHIRSISFLIADGVVPSNEGRGYVLRRILRRAMRHGNMLNMKEPFLFILSNTLVDLMKDTYLELEKARSSIASVIKLEEEKFLDTLERGLKILRNDIKEISAERVLSGDKAFKLYDTYGFPLDLTQDILKSVDMTVDTDEFQRALQEQKNRASWSGSSDYKEDAIWHTLKGKLNTTEFVGYEAEYSQSKIVAFVQNNKEVDLLSPGKAFLITESTPFYAECGGQCGDSGIVETKDGIFKVTNTVRFCDSIIAHEGEVISGYLKISDIVELKIDSVKRARIKANHTATHLLQAALKEVLGSQIAQRGSFLNEDRLRFDFSHHSHISSDDLAKVEKIINKNIMQNLVVTCKVMPKEEAISSGVVALFGEKYGNFVRAICIGPSNEKVSFELCGGTHVQMTGSIGAFKILSESSIGSGIRRIEAITGSQVFEYLGEMECILNGLSEKLKCNMSDISCKIDDLLSELKSKNSTILTYKQKSAIEKIQVTEKNGIHIYSVIVEDYNISELRSLNEAIRSKNSSGIIIIIDKGSEKVSLVVSVSSDLQKSYNAGEILKAGLVPLNGKGGGNAIFAQGGGIEKSKIAVSIEQMISAV